MDNNEYDDDTFQLTTRIVEWNPDYYTVWNYRRIILAEAILKYLNDEDKQKVFARELQLFLQLIKINPKSYWMWNHRFWCLQNMPNPNWRAELGLVDKMLSLDARNFHGWNYRSYVVKQLLNREEDTAKIIKDEYDFTTKKINQSFSNYSAWHRRSKLLPEIVSTMSEKEKNEVALNELDLVKNAIYTDPDDQSAWLYYWWLVGRATENVSLQGAFRYKNDPSIVIIAYNDEIRVTGLPIVVDTDGKHIPFKLYPLGDKTGCQSSSIWILVLSVMNAKQIMVATDTILPSSASKTVPQNTLWKVDIKAIDRSDERLKLLKERLNNGDIKEWKPLSARVYQDPALSDQAAWFTLDKVQLLKDEINAIKELLELEPNSAWALQTLLHFMDQLQLRSNNLDISVYSEIIKILDKLSQIDSDRKMKYMDQKDQYMFKIWTHQLSMTNSVNSYDETGTQKQVDLRTIHSIPLYSPLLLVREIIVPTVSLQEELLEILPFLETCTVNEMTD
ncbi:hypothetical protein BDF20DRAFT_850602 [Mycotypha africana]|uniref:uncharacterized protein n=1 Tax=Mycotypha africana TaxID=64632 RepID=UPI002301BD77|nr:uncharacterized protein BDF20DRAFT_850602 [Mycotypha africana]KAI8987501.1 hypothetical protein BDF20DRAFT_850602 [Mycotypha africana]